jgi:Ca-activated chloride channel homolog
VKTRPATPWVTFTLAAVSLVLPASTAAPERPAVEFVRPLNLQTVVGPTEIELRVTVPAGVRIAAVSLSVDGTPLARLTAPPWRTGWDAGDGSAGYRLDAVLELEDGTTVRATVRTSPLRIDQVEEVALVNLFVVVRDAAGNYVQDLAREDLRLWENGRPQRIERFGTERRPLNVALVLDSSLSMQGSKMDAARQSALGFLDALEPGDEAVVIAFGDDVQVLQELTSDRRALADAVRRVEAKGGTALYDAVWRASNLLAGLDGRRVLVLLSDGQDMAESGLEPGSLHTLDESLERALRSEVMIFPIGFGRNLHEELDFYRRRTLTDILGQLADRTGGRLLLQSRPGQLRRTFQEIVEDLRRQYFLAYVSDDPRRDGTWREIRLAATRPGLQVTVRKGYYAPTASEARAEEHRPSARGG